LQAQRPREPRDTPYDDRGGYYRDRGR
jgi:hypothetical protein